MTDNRFFENICFLGVRVISGVRNAGRAVNCLKGRPENGVFFLRFGEAIFREESGRLTTVFPGELLFIPRGAKYSMEYIAPETHFILVNFNTMTECGEPIIIFDGIRVLATDDELGRIEKIMTSLEMCGKSRNISAYMRKKELLYRLFGHISKSAPIAESDSTSARIFEGVRLLEETYLENLPITVFADACHFSVNSFRRHFSECFGISPVKYRNNMRIRRARELLAEGGFTVSETAYACGFDNVGYFCRCYLKTTGETPSETRRKFSDDK